jgi:3-oxoacyl-[acyl-carrier-protein] synthase III
VDRRAHRPVARMSEVTVDAVTRAGLTLEDIEMFVFHQANARITKGRVAA